MLLSSDLVVVLIRKRRSKSLATNDPAATHDLIAAIENGCLSGGDGPLWFVENYARAIVRQRRNRRGRGSVTIAHAHLGANGSCRVVEGDPVHTRSGKLATQQLFSRPDHHPVLIGVY